MSAPLSLQELGPQVVEAIGRFLSGDISFAELQSQTGLSAEELAQCLPDYVGSVNNYSLTQGGDQVVQLPSYTPPAPGAHESVYEASIEQYQYNIVNNVTVDNSEDITQVINNYGDGDVNAQIADDGGVNVDDSTVDGVINTGEITDSNVVGSNTGTINQTGDVTAGAGAAVNTGQGSAETTGSGTTFGEGAQGNVNAVSDSTDVNQNANQADVDITGDSTGGGNAGDGGAGGAGGAEGPGGPGGPGGDANPGGDNNADGIDLDINQSNVQDVEPDDVPTIL